MRKTKTKIQFILFPANQNFIDNCQQFAYALMHYDFLILWHQQQKQLTTNVILLLLTCSTYPVYATL